MLHMLCFCCCFSSSKKLTSFGNHAVHLHPLDQITACGQCPFLVMYFELEQFQEEEREKK